MAKCRIEQFTVPFEPFGHGGDAKIQTQCITHCVVVENWNAKPTGMCLQGTLEDIQERLAKIEARLIATESPREPGYLYAYVKCGRKGAHAHLIDAFRGWEEVSAERGDYVEHVTYRIASSGATADDRQIARDYSKPFEHPPE
jgi:hypothetical protein